MSTRPAGPPAAATTAAARSLLACHTTLRLGGPARRLVEARSPEEIVSLVAAADRAGEPVLVLGGGSNLVVADAGFPGLVVRVATRGVTVRAEADGKARVEVAAGEAWDGFVDWCVTEGLVGVECLAGIPGLAGATPIQNVGAYGQEVADTIIGVRVFDRRTGRVADLAPTDCGFTYRGSVFKRAVFKRGPRYVVLAVTFLLDRAALSRPVRYAELARLLGVQIEERVPPAQARAAVLELRRGKGMVLDPADPDTRSAGSFFTNPVLAADELAALERRVAERLGPRTRLPRFPAGVGVTKVSAAWLIEQAGFARGYGHDRVRISRKHTLALTTADGATTAELLALAREIRDGVRAAFGVELRVEPALVGVTL